MMLRKVTYALIKAAVAHVAVVALTWAIDYRYSISFVDGSASVEVRDGDTVH